MLFEGNHGDLASNAQVNVGKAVALKWVDLASSTGNWNLLDRIEDDAAPGTAIGRIIKIESANPTIRLYYINGSNVVDTAPDILNGVVLNNMDDTSTGTVNGNNSVRTLGSSTKFAQSAARKNRFGTSGGTAKCITSLSGATHGGPDVADRLSGGLYIDEQNTEFVAGASDKIISLSPHGDLTLAEYQALSDSGNVYGTGSTLISV